MTHTPIGVRPLGIVALSSILIVTASLAAFAADTNCEDGNGPLDSAPLQAITPQAIITKFAAAETAMRLARNHYTYRQDVLIQTLNGIEADGEFREVTNISYDSNGKRLENVAYATQSTLRGIQISQEDLEDIRVFMPFSLGTAELPEYKLLYAGQQRIDELNTYVFHVEPQKIQPDKRYFQGRIWVDSRDFQIVKTCGKSLPDRVHTKKQEFQDIQPMFVTYRQQIDGHTWFPAYTRVDSTIHFKFRNVVMREIIKYSDYKRSDEKPIASASHP
ncbi:MAG TPA: hypothetical protein VFA74_18265 [Terriglobales bacterium]|nr:hypothetical protein [Terriglobales bacterium]